MTSYKVKKVTPDGEVGRIIHEEILDEFCKSYVLVGEDETCLAEEYLKYAEEIKNFEVRNSDVWIASYPKTGTTWTQEMVWMIANDLDFESAETGLYIRSPFFESCTIMDGEKLREVLNLENVKHFEDSLKYTAGLKSPRFIKTHLPYSLLPDEMQNGTKSPKIIYVWRNPKDSCVSYCHHGNLLQGWRTSLENFSKVFMDGKAQYGSFWKHVLGYWEHRNSPNQLIIKYEDMKADLPAIIRKVARFLEKQLTDQKITLLCEHLSFESMKSNKSLNAEEYVESLKKHNLIFHDGSFIRAGTVGKYKEELSAETIKKLDAWIEQNITGTSFEPEYNYSV